MPNLKHPFLMALAMGLIVVPCGWTEDELIGPPVPAHRQPLPAKISTSANRTEPAALKPLIQPPSPVRAAVKSVVVPSDTVIHIRLTSDLNSNDCKQGDAMEAVVTDPVYVGPFLVIPEESRIRGSITEVNKKKVKKGPNPYVIVDFYELQRPGEAGMLPFKGTLIAYKTGLNKEDYVWRLPRKSDKLRAGLTDVMENAAYGLMINPIFGGPIGAGVGLLKTVAVNKVAERGAVKIKPKEVIPIAVQQEFRLPVIQKPQQASVTGPG